jgi:hypothetical protein
MGAKGASVLALTPVALRAPSVSAKTNQSVKDVPGTKCQGCIGLDTATSRQGRPTWRSAAELALRPTKRGRGAGGYARAGRPASAQRAV